MNSKNLNINPEEETKKITKFLKKTFKEQNISKAVLGLSGGIDSATSLYLLKNAIPLENIIVLHLPYFDEYSKDIDELIKHTQIPKKNVHIISIKPMVDVFAKKFSIDPPKSFLDKIRFGNIAARVRMTVLFDMAKKHNALVVGTENKSEYLLSYFTRFGDEASDLEPIQQLYKTQVYQLAEYLKVPERILQAKPTAGLWRGQTDESEFGFTYEEADQVLFRYFEKKRSIIQIKKEGFENAEKIIKWVEKNEYKHKVPYKLK